MSSSRVSTISLEAGSKIKYAVGFTRRSLEERKTRLQSTPGLSSGVTEAVPAPRVGGTEVTPALHPYPAYKPSGGPWLGDVPRSWQVRRIKTLLRESEDRKGQKTNGAIVTDSCKRSHTPVGEF